MAYSISPARRAALLSVALASLLFLAYVLTLAGVARANDELWILDVTESVATGNDYQFNQTLYINHSAGVEPVQPLLAAPLYWLALNTSWVGNMHAMALFNPLITVLTALLLFHHALMLGYGERSALAAALLFGLATMAWPYTQYYFREPLTGLAMLAAITAWEHWRQSAVASQWRRWAWFGIAITVTMIAMLSKESALIILPMFVLLALPNLAMFRQHRKQALIAAISVLALIVLAVIGLLAFKEAGAMLTRYRFMAQFRSLVAGLPASTDGLLGYFVSPGKAIWWYSPITMLALASPILLPRARWRESWLMLGTVFWFGLIYAANKGDIWFGGAGWGARFMLPIIPFLMIAALPAIDRAINSVSIWLKLLLIALGAWGLIVNIGGVYVNIYSYYSFLEKSVKEVSWLGPALWDFRWSQAIGSLLFLPQAKTDILWLTPAPDWLMIALFVLGVALALGLLVRFHRAAQPSRALAFWATASPLIALAITLFGLSRAFMDARYLADNPALWQLKADLEQNLDRGDTIMLSTRQYAAFFLNYYKGKAIWYALPDSPGERFSPEQPPEVVSDNINDLVASDLVTVFKDVSEGGSRYHARPVWLVVDTGPFLPWSTRPPEHYLANVSYTISVTEYNPRVRLVGYLPHNAPSSLNPERPVDAVFGPSIHLIGYDVWSSTGEPERVHAGDMLGVSLVWKPARAIDTDYTIAVHWIDSNGQVVAQQDRQPVGGFRPTSAWKPGKSLRDNYGFVVPDLAPGKYSIRVTLYQWPSLERLAVTDSRRRPLGDSFGLFTLEVR